MLGMPHIQATQTCWIGCSGGGTQQSVTVMDSSRRATTLVQQWEDTMSSFYCISRFGVIFLNLARSHRAWGKGNGALMTGYRERTTIKIKQGSGSRRVGEQPASPALYLPPRCTSVWSKAVRRPSRSSTHFWSTSRATRRSWATAATSVARTSPRCTTWACTSTPTASCHSTAPRRTAPSTSTCPPTARTPSPCGDPEGQWPRWFWLLRTRGNRCWPSCHSSTWQMFILKNNLKKEKPIFFPSWGEKCGFFPL